MDLEEYSFMKNEDKKNPELQYLMSNDKDPKQEDSWAVIGAFFKQYGLVSQQIASFNNFLKTIMQEIIEESGQISISPKQQFVPGEKYSKELRYEIHFEHLYVFHKPNFQEKNSYTNPIYPSQARIRNLTYETKLYVNLRKKIIEVNKDSNEEKVVKNEVEEKVPLGSVPIMVRSDFCILHEMNAEERIRTGECEYDQGGYFIINGGEKVIVAQEKMTNNFVYVFKKKQPSKYSWVAEIRSFMVGNDRPSTFTVKYYHKTLKKDKSQVQILRCSIPYIKDDIPLVILFRALGFESDKEILEMICHDLNDKQLMELLRPSFEEADPINSTDFALDWIARRTNQAHTSSKDYRIKLGKEILQKKLLPHLGQHNETKKAYFIGYMVQRLASAVLGRSGEDDRDHYGKKRLDMVGLLMGELFRQKFRQFKSEAEQLIQRQIDKKDIINLTSACARGARIITEGLKYALATGNWGKPFSASMKTGVAQVLNRQNFFATLSHCRRLNAPLSKQGKLAKPRQLHNTHWGMICPSETPEGQSCGLIKNLSLMSVVSVGVPTDPLQVFLEENDLENLVELHPKNIPGKTKVFLNGCWVGVHEKAEELVQNIKAMRRNGDIPKDVSIVRDIVNKEIKIYTDAGRVQRPVFIVENNKMKIKKSHIKRLQMNPRDPGYIDFNYLLNNGIVEFLDVEEEETCMISMNIKTLDKAEQKCFTYTHCEIHPSMILGVCASIIPFPDHNQSPRNTYQSAMGKQGMGVYASNYQLRMDTLGYVLFYPQKPLCLTKSMEFMHFNNLPSGINSITAIACFTGYNQEDSIIMNKGSIDRGFFRSVFYRTYHDSEEKGREYKSEEFGRPPPSTTLEMRRGTYDKLDIDGLVFPATRVSGDDIIIGKIAKIQIDETRIDLGKKTHKDSSIPLRRSENGIIDSVMITNNYEGFKFVKVKVRSVRIPQIGDKFASRHGQKGTIGMTYKQEDMLFTREGITPDIIINPHAIPSRMTIGHLIECLSSKVASIEGIEGDGSPFTDLQVVEIANRLHKLGYQKHGNEALYNPFTGEKLECLIFFGPTYYQRLKHMVDDKIHSRSRGPVQNLNRQPSEGRSRDGGLRFGEMERDCIIAHGASKFLKEKLFDVSDCYKIHVCQECGLPAIANLNKNEYECKRCIKWHSKKTKVNMIKIPYACKLLMQELMAMNIAPRIITDIK